MITIKAFGTIKLQDRFTQPMDSFQILTHSYFHSSLIFHSSFIFTFHFHSSFIFTSDFHSSFIFTFSFSFFMHFHFSFSFFIHFRFSFFIGTPFLTCSSWKHVWSCWSASLPVHGRSWPTATRHRRFSPSSPRHSEQRPGRRSLLSHDYWGPHSSYTPKFGGSTRSSGAWRDERGHCQDLDQGESIPQTTDTNECQNRTDYRYKWVSKWIRIGIGKY